MRPSSAGSRRISKRVLPASAWLAISTATPLSGIAGDAFALAWNWAARPAWMCAGVSGGGVAGVAAMAVAACADAWAEAWASAAGAFGVAPGAWPAVAALAWPGASAAR